MAQNSSVRRTSSRHAAYIDRKLPSKPQKSTPSAIDSLLKTLEDLEILDGAEEAIDLADWCSAPSVVKDLPATPSSVGSARTPLLSHSPSSSIDSTGSSSFASEGLRRISASAFTGTIAEWYGQAGVIRGRTGTSYAFRTEDLPESSRASVAVGLPASFQPAVYEGQPCAQRVTIEWATVLLQSLRGQWKGPPLPDMTVTLSGKVLKWDSLAVKGVVTIASPSKTLKATLIISEVIMNDVDRVTCSGGFPVTVDVRRRKDDISYTATSLRVCWRSVLETMALKQSRESPFHAILRPAAPRQIGVPGFRASKAPRRLPPRPLAATLMRLDGQTGKGTLKSVHDGTLHFFALSHLLKEDDTDFRPASRVFFWLVNEEVVALLGRARPDSEKWPRLRVCRSMRVQAASEA